MLSLTPRPLYLRADVPGTHWIEVWVDLRAGTALWRTEIPLTLSRFEPENNNACKTREEDCKTEYNDVVEGGMEH
jgi:hypothetical protein